MQYSYNPDVIELARLDKQNFLQFLCTLKDGRF